MLRKIYDWIIALAEKPIAPWALGIIAFTESSFFIVPPDVLLAPMTLSRPDRAWRYALICTIGSVAGGVLGYVIGHLLFESFGMWILDLYGLAGRIGDVKAGYDKYGAWLIIAKGFTPIPFKLVTIVSGALDYNFPLFVVLSIITRGARFYLLAGLLNRFGDPIRRVIENRLSYVVFGITALTIIGLIAAAHLA